MPIGLHTGNRWASYYTAAYLTTAGVVFRVKRAGPLRRACPLDPLKGVAEPQTSFGCPEDN